jgi:tetratricopeptide (TPR) repeat protein
MRARVLPVALVLLSGCQTTLRQARQLPPSIVLPGPLEGVEVTGPFRDDALVILEEGLREFGQPVRCEPGAGCQAHALVQAKISDTSVSPQLAGKNLLHAMSEVIVQATVEIDVLDPTGKRLSSRRYFGSVNGNVLQTPIEPLKARAVAAATRRFLGKFLPRQLDMELVVETGGLLEPGIERALSGDLGGAETEFNGLTQKDPDHAAAWYDLGVIRELSGDDERALEAYRRAAGLRGKSHYRQAVNHLERRMDGG